MERASKTVQNHPERSRIFNNQTQFERERGWMDGVLRISKDFNMISKDFSGCPKIPGLIGCVGRIPKNVLRRNSLDSEGFLRIQDF